jgi:hypothetical protein
VYVVGQSLGLTQPDGIDIDKILDIGLSGTVVASSQNPSKPGQSVTFTASVSGQGLTGTVTFRDGSTIIGGCSAVALNGGQASCAITFAAAGLHSITARYSGDANNGPSVSTKLAQVVGNASSTTLVSSVNPSPIGQTVLFSATVGGKTPIGTVTFRDGAIVLCANVPLIAGKKDKSSAVTCTATGLSVGAHLITATYSGDANNAGSVSAPFQQVVNPPAPGVALTSSLNPSKFGDSVTFTAKVTGQAPTGTATFKDGAGTLCSAVLLQGGGNTVMATCSTAALAIGSHSISAMYSGDANNIAAKSPLLTQTVKKPRT